MNSFRVRVGRVFPTELIRICPRCGSGDIMWCNISVRPFCDECKYWGAINYGPVQEAVDSWNKTVGRSGL